MTARERILRPKAALGEARDEHRGQEERHCVEEVRDGGSPDRVHDGAHERADGHREGVDGHRERVRVRELVVRHEVRDGGIGRREEEACRDTRDGSGDDEAFRRVHERQRREDPEAHEVGGEHQPPAREPVDERPEEKPDHDDREEVRDEERGDPHPGAGQVLDLEDQSGCGDVRADARARGREEEVRERRRTAKETETAGALHDSW